MWYPLLWGIFLLALNLKVEASEPNLALKTLNKYLDQKVNELKLKIHRAIETDRLRRKRNTEPVPVLPEEKALIEQHLKVKEAIPQKTEIAYVARGWADILYNKDHLIFLATDENILLFAFDGESFKLSTSIETDMVYKLKTFVHFRSTWLVSLQYNKAFDEHYLQLYMFEDWVLQKKQRISLLGESDIDTVSSKGNHYLAVSTYTRKTTSGKSVHAQTRLYEWRKTQFDLIATIPTKGARSVCAWSKEGTLYLVIAQEKSDENDYSIGSPVYTYNPRKEAQLTYIQRLPTYGPYKVTTFTVGGSRYLIVIENYGFQIYWWAGEQFLSWQKLDKESDYKYPVDVAVLPLPNKEMMIALAFKDNVVFFTEDAAANYVETFKAYMPENIATVSFMHKPNMYYYLLITVGKKSTLHNQPSVWKLNFTTYELPYLPTFDPLITCLVELNGSLTERTNEIQKMVNIKPKIWVKDEIKVINTSPISMNEMKMQNSAIVNMDIVTNLTNIPPWTNSILHQEVLGQQLKQQKTMNDMENVVWRSKDQDLKGHITLDSVMVLENLVKESFLGNSINNIPLVTLSRDTLKSGLSQILMGQMEMKNLKADEVWIHKQLNNIYTSDLLLINNITVTGNCTFFDLEVNNIEVVHGSTINRILPSALVTKSKDQVLTGYKNLKSITCESIEVAKTTNMKDLSEVATNAISINKNCALKGYVTFDSPLHISGNIAAGLINGVNLTFVSQNTLLKTTEQIVTGRKKFLASLTATSIEINKINSINIEEAAKIKVSQELSKSITFRKPVHIIKDLNTVLINGQQLNSEIVLKEVDQQIGQTFFTTSASVEEDITMAEYKTVNGVDPSELQLLGTTETNAVVVTEPSVFQQIIVHNLIVDSSGSNLKSLATESWLKSKPQIISMPVSFLGSVTVDNSTVVNINNYGLDTDFAHAFGDKIVATKTLREGLIIQHALHVDDMVTINGFDLSEAAGITELGVPVAGKKTVSSLMVNGDINVSSINNLALSSDAMVSDRWQVVTGQMKFTKPTYADDMNAEEITLNGTLNGILLQEFKSKAVLTDNFKTLPLEKEFDWLAVHNMVSIGLISSVDFVQLHKWAVTENNYNLHSPLNFTGPLKLATAVATHVNGLSLDKHIQNIVSNSGLVKIRGPKTLSYLNVEGKVKTMDLINGIDVKNLLQHSFMKSGNSHIEVPLTFGDLTTDELTASVLNGIDFSNLAVEGSNMESSSSFTANITIEGDLNTPFLNCDLERIFRNSVYMDGTSIINGKKTLTLLNLTGNMEIVGTINGLYVTAINETVMELLHKGMDKNLVFMNGLQANSLVLSNNINMIDLTLLLKDAVTISSKEIAGQKTFHSTSKMALHDVVIKNINADSVNSVNTLELNSIVTKNGTQEINGGKILQYVKASSVNVSGLVNGLNVLELITINGSNTVYGPTYLSAPDTILLNLTVEGLIDSVDINALVMNRISLDTTEEAYSNFTFNIVEIGSLNVKKINDVDVSTLVLKYTNSTILSPKSFNSLTTLSNFYSGLVNGIDVEDVGKNLVRFNERNEFSNMVFLSQLDTKSIKSSLLNALTINPVVESFTRVVNKSEELLRNFNSNVENHNFQLQVLFNAQADQSSLAYFDLKQELELGPTQEFMEFPMNQLHRSIFDNATVKKLTVWASDKTCDTEDCCRNYTSYILNVQSDGTLKVSSGPHLNRYFPVVFTTQGCKSMTGRCSEVWTSYLDTNETQLPLLRSEKIRKVKLLEMDETIYMIVVLDSEKTDLKNLVVYQRDPYTKIWSVLQHLENIEAIAFDVLQTQDWKETFLAVTHGLITDARSGASQIFHWDKLSEQFILIKSIPGFPSCIKWVDNGLDYYLVIAENFDTKKCIGKDSIVNVYMYNKNDFIWIQSIGLRGVTSMLPFRLGGETYLLAASHYFGEINLLELKGYSGFRVVQVIPSPGVEEMLSYWVSRELYVAVASSSGHTRVLKAVVRGTPAHWHNTFP